MAIRNSELKQAVFTLSVVSDDRFSKSRVLSSSQMLEKALLQAASMDIKVEALTRIDTSIPLGIARAANEVRASDIVMGLSERQMALENLFGSVMQSLLMKSDQTIWIMRLNQPLNTHRRLLLVMPPDAEAESSFSAWVLKVAKLSSNLGIPLSVRASQNSLEKLSKIWKDASSATFQSEVFTRMNELPSVLKKTDENDLVVVVGARQGAVSHRPSVDTIPTLLGRHSRRNSIVVIYPGREAAMEQDIAV